MNFNSAKDLYEKVKPALEIKEAELKNKNINMSCQDIFNYLGQNKWVHGKNLSLFDIVNDILYFKVEESIGSGFNETENNNL